MKALTKQKSKKITAGGWLRIGISLHVIGYITRYMVSELAGAFLETTGTIFLIVSLVSWLRNRNKVS